MNPEYQTPWTAAIASAQNKMPSRRRDHSRHGITLVEVMIAVLILGITLGGSVVAITTYSRIAEAANRRIAAIHTARNALESLARSDFFNPLLSVGTHSFTNGSYKITNIPTNNLFSSQKQIVATVAWTNPSTGQVAHETLTTIVSESLRP